MEELEVKEELDEYLEKSGHAVGSGDDGDDDDDVEDDGDDDLEPESDEDDEDPDGDVSGLFHKFY